MTENEAKKLIAKFCEDRMNFARGKDMSDKELEDFCEFSDALTLSISSLEEIQQYRAIGTVKYFKECADILNKTATDELAKIIDEWILYHKIGTVEECREARERQRGKKPEHFHKKYGKHKWRRTESGEIDECAWDFGNHNGVACEICGETVCVLCNPNYDELDDCEEEYWICPNCAKKIYCKDEYCQCGQHLDWSDTP